LSRPGGSAIATPAAIGITVATAIVTLPTGTL
jgi:hypothetical protein